jgi:glycosyltransferase involved in cell wall biosynthesis
MARASPCTALPGPSFLLTSWSASQLPTSDQVAVARFGPGGRDPERDAPPVPRNRRGSEHRIPESLRIVDQVIAGHDDQEGVGISCQGGEGDGGRGVAGVGLEDQGPGLHPGGGELRLDHLRLLRAGDGERALERLARRRPPGRLLQHPLLAGQREQLLRAGAARQRPLPRSGSPAEQDGRDLADHMKRMCGRNRSRKGSSIVGHLDNGARSPASGALPLTRAIQRPFDFSLSLQNRSCQTSPRGGSGRDASSGIRTVTSASIDSSRRWKVLIDASPVTNAVNGLSVYIVNLIRHLPPESFAEFDYTILLNPAVEWPELRDAIERHGVGELRERIAPIGPRRDLDMARFLKRHRGAFDLVHITSNNYPLALKGGVCTIHDVTFKTWFDRKRGIPGTAWLARQYMTLVIRTCLRRARAIIAVSDSTRREIDRLFRASPEEMAKIGIIHEGWEHLDAYQGECTPFGFEEGGYLFFLGSHRVHKNLTGLLEGFRRALSDIPPEKKLVISGSSGRLSDKHRSLLGEINAGGERVVFTGYVPNACVRRLYKNADAFIFPSLSEGFGLPVLEAFHSGTPLLCSRTTSLPEVAGEAAVYFDPVRAEDIARAIKDFYADPALRVRLRHLGRERLRLFSWKKAAAETVSLYRQCLPR